MSARPARLNAIVALLFIVGSACFVLGSVPAYVNAVGGTVDGVTYFVGSLFFTSASFAQLVQAQSPRMTSVDAEGQYRPAPVRLYAWVPHDRNWLAAATQFPGTVFFNVSTLAALAHNTTAAQEDRYVWRPDLYGSTLFLISSAFAVLAVSDQARRGQAGDQARSEAPGEARSALWRIAWLNMVGSILFMASALASYVLPSTDELLQHRASVVGTFLGAVCFLVGAALMFPAWRQSLRPSGRIAHPQDT